MSPYTARSADRLLLYQQAVQAPGDEVDFIRRVYRQHYQRRPTLLREDFCGTALVCCDWVCRTRENRAWGVDLCRDTLAWARRHNIGRLEPYQAARVRLLCRDVRRITRPKVDVVAALNFSYFVFREFSSLTQYFRCARHSLRRKGLLIVDAYGGPEAQQVMTERSRLRGFTYVWDQADYNPVNDHTRCHIHFEFPDGTVLRRAFTYEWRLWSLGTIQDALRAAGFRSTSVYFESSQRGRGDRSVYRKVSKAENTDAWIAYVVAAP